MSWNRRQFWHACGAIAASLVALYLVIGPYQYLHEKLGAQQNTREKREPRITGPVNK